MKKTLFLSSLALSLFAISCDKDDKVSQEVKDALYALYPDAKYVDWDVERNYIVADFLNNGVETEVTFQGTTWVKIETDITFDALPQVVKDAYGEGKYSNWNYTDVDEIKKPNNVFTYVIDVEQGESEIELTYAADGSLISVRND